MTFSIMPCNVAMVHDFFALALEDGTPAFPCQQRSLLRRHSMEVLIMTFSIMPCNVGVVHDFFALALEDGNTSFPLQQTCGPHAQDIS